MGLLGKLVFEKCLFKIGFLFLRFYLNRYWGDVCVGFGLWLLCKFYVVNCLIIFLLWMVWWKIILGLE